MKKLWILFSWSFNVFATLSVSGSSPPTQFFSQPQAGTPEVLGNTKVLVCAASGNPSPGYRWMKDGHYLSFPKSASDTALKLKNIQRSDAGRYQCVANNTFGAILSSSAFVHVAYMRPFANHGNADRYVSQGRAVVVDLPPIDCYPPPSVQWYEGNGKPVPREANLYHVTLKNQLVALDSRPNMDNKMFKATATNIYSQQTSDSQVFVLRVQNIGNAIGDIEPEIIIPPTNTVAVAGNDDAAKLECVANARPLSYLSIRWHRRSLAGRFEVVSSDTVKYLISSQGRVLTVRNPDVSDAGFYRCEALFQRPASHPVTVTADANLTVYVKPSFVDVASDAINQEVQTVLILPCGTTGLPKPFIKWYHNGQIISSTQAQRYIAVENGSLVIMNALQEHSGVYQCFAQNDAGEINSISVVTITSSAPKMLLSAYNRTCLTGDKVVLPCAAEGAPKPLITWSKASGQWSRMEPISGVNISKNDLILASIGVSDAGLYTCTAKNDVGTSRFNVYLQVAIRTRIVTPPQDVSVRKGSDVVLSCGVVNDRRFSVVWQWSLNGVRLDMTDIRHRQSMPDGSLHIRSSDGSDIGAYVCDVTSPGGNDSATARLNVIELPHQPSVTAIRLSDPLETSVDLRWMPPAFDGNSEIRKYIIYSNMLSQAGGVNLSDDAVDDSGQEWQVIGYVYGKDSTTYTVHQLQPSQSYQFCVSAMNEMGEGRQSLPSSTIAIPSQPPSGPPRGVVGSPRSNSSVILQWQIPEKSRWNGPLLGYMISYKLAGYPDSTLSYENITSAEIRISELHHLEAFQEYDVAIAAYNAKGIGVYSNYARVRTQEGHPVAPPTDVVAVASNSISVGLSWTPPHRRHINGINQGYKVTAKPVGNGAETDDTEVVVVVIPSNTSNMDGRQSASLNGLKKFTKYQITILCFTSKGDGPKSRPEIVQTLEDVPDQVGSLTFGNTLDTLLQVFWTRPQKPNGIVTGYVVKYRPAEEEGEWMTSGELSTDVNEFTIKGTRPRTSYQIDVIAKTRVGFGVSRVVTIESGIPPEKPEAPFNLVVKTISSTSVQIRLTPSFTGHTSIVQWIVEVERKRQMTPSVESSWEVLAAIASTGDNLLDVAGLRPDSDNRLRVSAENVAGRSGASEPTDWFCTLPSRPFTSSRKVVVRAVDSGAAVVACMPLSESEWNGKGRHYALRYWPCQEKNLQYQTVTTKDDNMVSLTIDGLKAWTMYCIQVAACNEIGCSEYSDTVSDRTKEAAPSAGPEIVTVEPINSTSLIISWSRLQDVHRNGRVLGYKVLYKSTLDLTDSVETVFSEKQMAISLNGLDKFTWYQIEVLAFTRAGDGPPSSPIVAVQTLDDVSGPPSGVFFPELTETTARISWSSPVRSNGIIIGYSVAYGIRSLNLTRSSQKFSFEDDSLERNRQDFFTENLERDRHYLFRVIARTQRGWGEPAEVEVFTTSKRRIPDAPSQPSVGTSQVGDRWLIVTWTPGSNGYAPVRNYTIQVEESNSGTFLTLADYVRHDVTEYNVTGLIPNRQYRLRLAASNDVGISEFSSISESFQTHQSIPDLAPTDVAVVGQTTSTALVTWMPPKDDVSWNGGKVGYQILYRQIHDEDDNDDDDDDDDDDEGEEDNDDYYDENAYQVISNIYPQTTILLVDLVALVTYEVKVAFVNNIGHGPMSKSKLFSTMEPAPSSTPHDLRLFVVGSNTIHITWKSIPTDDDHFPQCLGYKIYFWVVGNKSNTTRVKYLSPTENATSVEDLKMFTEYAFIIAAFNVAGSGPNSSIPVTARTEDGLPGSVDGLTILIMSLTSAALSWQPPSEPNGLVEGYELTYFPQTLIDGESKSVNVLLSGEKTSYQARDLRTDVNYTFRLRAKTRHGFGPEFLRSIVIGTQPGSPSAPTNVECTESDVGLIVTWTVPDAGSLPLLSYIVQYCPYDADPVASVWQTMTVVSSVDVKLLEPKAIVSFQQLLPDVSYLFRVFAVNSRGISPPSQMVQHLLPAAAIHSEPIQMNFYQQWWFLVVVAFVGVVLIVVLIVVLCMTGQKRRKIFVKDKQKKKKNIEIKTVEQDVMYIDDETGFATIDRRHLQSWGGSQKYPKASTLPRYVKAPPRPSPGSIQYDTEIISQHEDSGNVSDKASNNDDSDDVESENQSTMFLDRSTKRPQSLYCTMQRDDTYPYSVSLNGGHNVASGHRTLKPTKLSSFV